MPDNKSKTDGITVEALRKQYPDQIAEISAAVRAEVTAEINVMNPHQLQEAYPGVVKKLQVPIIKDFTPASGFIVERDDPYGAGVAKDYAHARGCAIPGLPMILPWPDPATIVALKSYLVRAQGAGDSKRAQAVVEAWKKYSSRDVKELLGK